MAKYDQSGTKILLFQTLYHQNSMDMEQLNELTLRKIFSVVGLVLFGTSLTWLIFQPGPESLFVFVGSIIAFLASYLAPDEQLNILLENQQSVRRRNAQNQQAKILQEYLEKMNFLLEEKSPSSQQKVFVNKNLSEWAISF